MHEGEMREDTMGEQTTLNKGQSWSEDRGGYRATVEHVDRRDDSYLSGVVTPDGRLVGTGLHATFAAAKAHCRKYMPKGSA